MNRARKRKGIICLLLAFITVSSLMVPVAMPTTVTAGSPSPFATEVVSFSGPFGPSPYDDPNAVLGKPTTIFKDPGNPPTERVKLVEPAYNVGLSNEPLITTLNEGAEIVVMFDHQVEDDPDNPYGIDLLVFGNSFFTGSGYVNDETDMNTCMLTGGGFFEPIKVSVSQDGIDWYRYESGPYGDDMFPTQAYLWDRVNTQWTDTEMDWTKPVNPALTLGDFAGLSAADAIDLYDGSAGGAGFDLAESGYAWIQYVKVEGLSGFCGGEIDAFADVAPVTSCPDWDVNEDGGIDILDVACVGLHWGETGDPGWIREDVNNDGSVDILDVAVIGLHWGE